MVVEVYEIYEIKNVHYLYKSHSLGSPHHVVSNDDVSVGGSAFWRPDPGSLQMLVLPHLNYPAQVLIVAYLGQSFPHTPFSFSYISWVHINLLPNV